MNKGPSASFIEKFEELQRLEWRREIPVNDITSLKEYMIESFGRIETDQILKERQNYKHI